MKKNALIIVYGLVTAILNFALFIVSYNHLATPYLQEEQRMENADFIMSYALGGYVFIAIVSAFVMRLVCKTQIGHTKP